MQPSLAFRADEQMQPELEVRVNFGVFAGRDATPAEIDGLARVLGDKVDAFSITSEQRHEFADSVEAAVHQIVIQVDADQVGGDREALSERIIAAAEDWAATCIADRHVELSA
jgi:hypothetical protein